jgi:hypothetical protein
MGICVEKMRFHIQIDSFPSTRVHYDVMIGDDIVLHCTQNDTKTGESSSESYVPPVSSNMTIYELLKYIIGEDYEESYTMNFICDKNISEEQFTHTLLYNSHLLGDISIHLKD